jgi:hypothetical protein
VIILEEAAHLKPQLFHNVIVPLLTVEHTAMLAITSPGDEQNYISVIQDLKNADGGDLFYNIQIGMMCEKCKNEEKEKCVHQLKRLPNWKSEGRHDLVRAVYGQQNQEAMKREAEGMVVSNRVYLFGKKDMNAFEKRELYNFEYDVQIIDVAMDPSGGGAQSDWTIVSKCIENGKQIVRSPSQHCKQLANLRHVRASAALVQVVSCLERRSICVKACDEEIVAQLQVLHERLLQQLRLSLQHEATEQFGVQQHVLQDHALLVVHVLACTGCACECEEQRRNVWSGVSVDGLRHSRKFQSLHLLHPERLWRGAEKEHIFHGFLQKNCIGFHKDASQPRHLFFVCCCLLHGTVFDRSSA